MYHNEPEASRSGKAYRDKQLDSPDQFLKVGNSSHISLANPLYRAILRYLESGDWNRSLLLLENLVAQYPQDQELLNLRQKLYARLNTKLPPYQSNPLYRAVKRHQRQGEWGPALMMVENLLSLYTQDQELRQLHQQLQLRLQLAKKSYTDDPLYRSMQRHIKQQNWEPAMVIVSSLLSNYPDVSELHNLREELQQQIDEGKENRSRTLLLAILGLLSCFLVSVLGLFFQYIREPVPLAQMVAPQANLNYAPHYLFSIYDVNKPSGVGVMSTGERIYVAEMAGDRMIRIFDRNGNSLGAFAPEDTLPGERAPVYLSLDNSSNVFVTDRLQHAVFVFDREGNFIDALLGPDLTLSEYVNQHTIDHSDNTILTLNLFENGISGSSLDEKSIQFDPFELPDWSPLGVRFDRNNRLILTDVTKESHRVYVVDLSETSIVDYITDFEPIVLSFGASGSNNGEFLFPNTAVTDSLDRVYVSDGNNGRISVWDPHGNFLYDFGGGSGESSLSLPHGLAIDDRDRLHVVDTVGQMVKVYDVSGTEPEYLFAFGDFGMGDGLFNFPNDIAMDKHGRLYITDRENNRVQVWSY